MAKLMQADCSDVARVPNCEVNVVNKHTCWNWENVVDFFNDLTGTGTKLLSLAPLVAANTPAEILLIIWD